MQVFNPAWWIFWVWTRCFWPRAPGLEQVLFTLRELRMCPNPRISRHGAARFRNGTRRESGVFSEEWCLETGRIYHVSGRPQPGGALAFFFEDVTSDATLARSLRQEIELGQAVFDGLQDAVVAFNRQAIRLLSQRRYSRIWGEDPCNDLADTGFKHALALWARTSAQTAFWSDLDGFATSAAARWHVARAAFI